MKVLMINSVCGIRSTGRICTDIAQQLTDGGDDCRIAYGREYVPETYAPYALRVGSELGVRLHGVQARVLDCAGFGSGAVTRRLVQQIRDYDPDIIHLHNLHGYYLNVEILFDYLKSAGKPVVWTFHDCWPFTGHCAHFSDAKCEKWKTGCESCPQKKEYPASLVLDRSRENYRRKQAAFAGVAQLTIVTPSRWLAELVKESFLGDYPVEVIPNGIDTRVFAPTPSDFRRRCGLEEKKIVLGVASAWSEKKGLDDMVRLAEALGDGYAVIVVGVSEGQKKTLPGNVIAITRTDSAKALAEIYTAADVFVNPTYEDNYPTVNLEAQACGTPVITYRTGGSVESVDGRCIVPQGDVNAMAEMIRGGAFYPKEDLVLDRAAMLQRYTALYERLLRQE